MLCASSPWSARLRAAGTAPVRARQASARVSRRPARIRSMDAAMNAAAACRPQCASVTSRAHRRRTRLSLPFAARTPHRRLAHPDRSGMEGAGLSVSARRDHRRGRNQSGCDRATRCIQDSDATTTEISSLSRGKGSFACQRGEFVRTRALVCVCRRTQAAVNRATHEGRRAPRSKAADPACARTCEPGNRRPDGSRTQSALRFTRLPSALFVL